MQLIDTHCHIHSSDYPLDAEAAYQEAIGVGVTKLMCVGTDVDDSKLAAQWATLHETSWASVGVHPHEAKRGINGIETLIKNKELAPKIVAIGEIGLDYHYMHSQKEQQIIAFEAQLQLALEYNLPVIFHVREAFADFWPIVSNFHTIRGVVHSFTDTEATLNRALAAGFFIGVNGIATFSKDKSVYKKIPLNRLLLETDAPYLTPAPYRGKVNKPAYVRLVGECMGNLHSISLDDIARYTSHNATQLFHI